MVSFWPFGGDDNSAASFEKALSQLSEKITTATARNKLFKHRQRKFKALWTIYTVFGYILIDIILILVTGWEQWGPFEWILVTGGPLGIYIVRRLLHAYYDSRLSAGQEHLNDLIKQREATLEKLKASTKYNSTQLLLEKYGGSPNPKRMEPTPHEQRKRQKSETGQAVQKSPVTPQSGRTGMPPPPTANIQPKQSPTGPWLPPDAPRPVSWAGGPPGTIPAAGMSPSGGSAPGAAAPGEDFAPNAFSPPGRSLTAMLAQPTPQYSAEGPKWYDRLMDVILGEDETQARNRLVLICQSCRLVNGQAPPGARTLEEVGRWRCSSCHAWNGVESEEKKVLKHAAQSQLREPEQSQKRSVSSGSLKPLGEDFEHVEKREREEEEDNEEEDGSEDNAADPVPVTPAASTRSKARQRKKA